MFTRALSLCEERMTARLLEAREPCTLLKSFIARQGVILIAGLIFLAWTASAAGQTRGLVTAHTALRAQGASSRPKARITATEEGSHRQRHATLHASFGAPPCIHQAIRVKLRYERRDLKTFCADCSKQAGQQMVGGALMVGMGLMLAKESGLDALAWYGAQYPFEIVLTTVFTGGAAG